MGFETKADFNNLALEVFKLTDSKRDLTWANQKQLFFKNLLKTRIHEKTGIGINVLNRHFSKYKPYNIGWNTSAVISALAKSKITSSVMAQSRLQKYLGVKEVFPSETLHYSIKETNSSKMTRSNNYVGTPESFVIDHFNRDLVEIINLGRKCCLNENSQKFKFYHQILSSNGLKPASCPTISLGVSSHIDYDMVFTIETPTDSIPQKEVVSILTNQIYAALRHMELVSAAVVDALYIPKLGSKSKVYFSINKEFIGLEDKLKLSTSITCDPKNYLVELNSFVPIQQSEPVLVETYLANQIKTYIDELDTQIHLKENEIENTKKSLVEMKDSLIKMNNQRQKLQSAFEAL